MSKRKEDLLSLWSEIRACEKCDISKFVINKVFGDGRVNADLMLVGEAPGIDEDKTGNPFVGNAGGILSACLLEAGLNRPSLFITNILKCLRGTTPVYLPDGSSRKIIDLVSSRYRGPVLSFDVQRNTFVSAQVIGWHRSPFDRRRWLKVSYKGAKHNSNGLVGSVATNDHEFLAQNEESYEWVPAENLNGRKINIGPHGLGKVGMAVAIGTLLGDSSITHDTAHLTCTHSTKQWEWARLKARVFNAEVHPGEENGYGKCHFFTKASRTWAQLRDMFYSNRQKIVPEGIENHLTDQTIATWFLDDGSVAQSRNGYLKRAEIATCNFGRSGTQHLANSLSKATGIKTSTTKSGPARILIYSHAGQTLLHRIARYIPPSMRYKLGSQQDGMEPYDDTLWYPDTEKPMWAEAVVEEFTGPSWKTAYCLSVKGTENFVTPGGVVHNCHPPKSVYPISGNRTPTIEEMNNCRPYLMQQIEIIQPKVIITLGMTATMGLLRIEKKLKDFRKTWFGTRTQIEINGITTPIIVTMHPQYLGYNASDYDLRRKYVDVFRRVNQWFQTR